MLLLHGALMGGSLNDDWGGVVNVHLTLTTTYLPRKKSKRRNKSRMILPPICRKNGTCDFGNGTRLRQNLWQSNRLFGSQRQRKRQNSIQSSLSTVQDHTIEACAKMSRLGRPAPRWVAEDAPKKLVKEELRCEKCNKIGDPRQMAKAALQDGNK